jgi:hypothetical protein
VSRDCFSEYRDAVRSLVRKGRAQGLTLWFVAAALSAVLRVLMGLIA